MVERAGASIDVKQARAIVERASRSPSEGSRKVLVLDEFHLLDPRTGGILLKTIEEPPPGTFFVVLAEEVTPDLVDDRLAVPAGGVLARVGRCRWRPGCWPRAWLPRRRRGRVVRPRRPRPGPPARHGRPAGHPARGLAAGPPPAGRLRPPGGRPWWTSCGPSSTTPEVTIDAAHEAERAELEAQVERYGLRGSGSTEMAKRQRREVRRFRTDEVAHGPGRAGPGLPGRAGGQRRPEPLLAGLEAIQAAAEALVRNPNEELLLQSLFLRLPPLIRLYRPGGSGRCWRGGTRNAENAAGQGAGEQEALGQVAAPRSDRASNWLGLLDAFGHDLQVERMGHAHHGGHDRRPCWRCSPASSVARSGPRSATKDRSILTCRRGSGAGR